MWIQHQVRISDRQLWKPAPCDVTKGTNTAPLPQLVTTPPPCSTEANFHAEHSNQRERFVIWSSALKPEQFFLEKFVLLLFFLKALIMLNSLLFYILSSGSFTYKAETAIMSPLQNGLNKPFYSSSARTNTRKKIWQISEPMQLTSDGVDRRDVNHRSSCHADDTPQKCPPPATPRNSPILQRHGTPLPPPSSLPRQVSSQQTDWNNLKWLHLFAVARYANRPRRRVIP